MMSTSSEVDWDYLDVVKKRLAERKLRLNETVDAEAKSLRKYATRVFPPFRERWDYWFNTSPRAQNYERSTSYEWICGHGDNWKPSAMMQWMLQSFYNYDESEYGTVIEVKVSNTTFLEDGRSVRETVRDDLTNLKSCLQQIPELLDYATSILGWSVVFDLFNDVKTSSLFTGINEYLQAHSFSFPAASRVGVRNRRIHRDLIMCVRYYPNRDDNRAYCKDLNKLRSLVGAALQRLILPKSMRMRRGLDYVRRIVPAKNKDKLDIHVAVDSNCVHLAIIADISNFTGSAANAWLMLCNLAIELAHGKISGKSPNIYCCDGAHFTATLVEVLVLYLYLTVGYPCTSEATSEFHTLPGGFLGVNANITIALLFYATLLNWLSWNRPNFVHYMRSQAGGDDVFILLKLSREDAERGRTWVQQHLSEYVGYVKELETFIVEDETRSKVVDNVKFCRKRVEVRRVGRSYSIKSEPAVPLNELLTTAVVPTSVQAQQKLWQTVQTGLNNFNRENSGYQWVTDALSMLAVEKLPSATMSQVITHYYEGDLELVIVGTRYCSMLSVEAANLVAPVFHLDNIYYGTADQAISFLMARGGLVMQRICYEGTSKKVVMTEREGERYRRLFRLRYDVPVVVTCNLDVLTELRSS
jgi:hypothetical protein